MDLGLRNLKATESNLSPTDPHILILKINLATQLRYAYRFAESLSIQQDVLAIATSMDNLDQFCSVSAGLGANYCSVSKYQLAITTCNTALAKAENASDTDYQRDQLILALREVCAMANLSLGNFATALESAQHVFEGRKRLFGKAHIHTLIAMDNLARAYAACKLCSQSWDLQEDMIRLMKASLGVDHPMTKHAIMMLAIFPERCKMGRRVRKQAILYRLEVLGMMRRDFGEVNATVLDYMRGIENEYWACGVLSKAVEMKEQVVLELRGLVGETGWDVPGEEKELAWMQRVVGTRSAVLGWLPGQRRKIKN